ncbi:MAG: laminin G domain-containing protein, partial [Firmicutes bacterium]|nr:laminin G domain-containing protein [Bacillota bacterium]
NANNGVNFLQNFLMYIDNDDKFGTLLENIESGALSPQIDTEGDILVGGFSMGGMAAVQAGAVHSTRIKKVGALSPSNSFITEQGVPGGYFGVYPGGEKDIYFSKDPDAFVLLSAGAGESVEFLGAIWRYYQAIITSGNNRDGLVKYNLAPAAWGGHGWTGVAPKEIFMFLYRNEYGVVPSNALVEQACNNITSYQAPTVLSSDPAHPTPVVAIEPYDGEVFVDLDVSTYAKDTTTDPAGAASIGSITNSGTLASSTTVKMSSQSGGPEGLDLSKETFANAMGTTTSYLKRTINSQVCNTDNTFNTIENAALETGANTISFWANYIPENTSSKYNLFDYSVTYDGETDPVHLFTLDQSATTNSEFVLTGRANKPPVIGKLSPAEYGDITDATAGKWAHYVITNPEYSSNGRKVMKIYVNGEYVYSKMVVKPSGNVTNAKIAFGGDASPAESIYWPTDFSLGDVKIYDGELTANEIMSEYTLDKDRYTVSDSELPNITGYTLSDSTVTYDGQKHMINVSATANATEDTTVTYTCNGAPFTGATEVGTYNVTATVSKTGYNDLILKAKLEIKTVYVPPVYNDGDVLIDLDMSTYAKDTTTDPSNASTSIGSITNNGALAASTVVKMSSQSGRWMNLDLTKKAFENEEGSSTSYLYRTINTPVCKEENKFNTIEEKALEAGANTIIFWANFVSNKEALEYNLFDYSVSYDGEKEPIHLFTLEQQATGGNKLVLTDRGQSPVYGDISNMANAKWAQYVITNPAYENGSKKMQIYVNGKYIGSKTVTQPSGSITSVKLAFGGEASSAKEIHWPEELSLGDVQVFGGVLSDSEIAAAYEESKGRYDEKGIELDFNVEFDSVSRAFNISTDNVLAGTNRILLVVEDSEENVVYMDAMNAVADDSVSFNVNLGENLIDHEYSFTLSSMGDTIVATYYSMRQDFKLEKKE